MSIGKFESSICNHLSCRVLSKHTQMWRYVCRSFLRCLLRINIYEGPEGLRKIEASESNGTPTLGSVSFLSNSSLMLPWK